MAGSSALGAELLAKAEAARDAMEAFMSAFSPDSLCSELGEGLPALRLFFGACRSTSDFQLLIAHLASKREAGDLVGSSKPADFIAELFDISYRKAWGLIHEGNRLYNPPEPPPPPDRKAGANCDDEGDNAGADDGKFGGKDAGTDGTASNPANEEAETEAESGTDNDSFDDSSSEESTAHHAEQECYEREREAHEELQNKLKDHPLGEAKQQAITFELRNLKRNASPGYKEIFSRALDEARFRSVFDLRMWVRDQVKKANRKTEDPLASYVKRDFKIGTVDADGGAYFSGYAHPAMLALFDVFFRQVARPDHGDGAQGGPDVEGGASVANAEARSSAKLNGENGSANAGDGSDRSRVDERSSGQKRADALFRLLHRYASDQAVTHHGVGSIVVSMTVDDLRDVASPGGELSRRFVTNTHAELNAFDLLVLGATEIGFATLHDGQGNPLAAVKGRRCASVLQKIALVASELVCTAPGCSEPAINCDVHHIYPWSSGGATLIDNLTLLCRRHHMNNNDHRDPNIYRPYAERDEQTGRVGHTYPPRARETRPKLRFNESVMAQKSAGARIRRRESRHYRSRMGSPADEASPQGAGMGSPADEAPPQGTGASGPIRKTSPRWADTSGQAGEAPPPGVATSMRANKASPRRAGTYSKARVRRPAQNRASNAQEPADAVAGSAMKSEGMELADRKASDPYRSRLSGHGWSLHGGSSQDQPSLFNVPR